MEERKQAAQKHVNADTSGDLDEDVTWIEASGRWQDCENTQHFIIFGEKRCMSERDFFDMSWKIPRIVRL